MRGSDFGSVPDQVTSLETVRGGLKQPPGNFQAAVSELVFE